MPNYKYYCPDCDVAAEKTLLISSDPKEKLQCGSCKKLTMERRISLPARPMGFKVWAGDWYKKTYGQEIGERDKNYASEQAKIDKAAKELKKQYGIEIKHESKRIE
jgi:putative FmdB family regulatory protein